MPKSTAKGGIYKRTLCPLEIKLSGRLLKRLRHKPAVAVVVAVAQIHVSTAKVQVVRVTTIAGISTGRPVVTVETKVAKPTTVVTAQRREEEIVSNHTSSGLAILGRISVVIGILKQIFTIGICLL